MGDPAGEAVRNGAALTEYVEHHLLDVDERLQLMDDTGIELNAISELGVDRAMFSADYPYETMEEAAAWLDNSLPCHDDARRIGRENARNSFASSVIEA